MILGFRRALDRGRGWRRLELAGAESIQDPWLRFRVFDASEEEKNGGKER